MEYLLVSETGIEIQNKIGGEHMERIIYICSDSVGETADKVVQATTRQFHSQLVQTVRYANVRQEDEIRALMEEAATKNGFIAYTLVQPELREMIRMESIRLGIRAVDIMGPMMQAFVDTFNDAPSQKPGLLHQMDEEYFRRIEAIEFTVKSDDGRDSRAMLQSQIVLLGVSRTSKTPLSMYLAHRGYKVTNFPLVPEVKVPTELFHIPKTRIVGLTMDPDRMTFVRTERLRTMGLPPDARYSAEERILEELEFADQLFKQLGCRIINVTHKAIEETAALILEGLHK